MSEYFRSWRRKIGVVALLMAVLCLLLAARSSTITDQLEVPVGDSIHFFTSTQGYFRWTRHAERQIWKISPVWYTIEYGSPGQPLDQIGEIDWTWRLDAYLFDLGQGFLRRSSLTAWTFSYLNGIPLTGIAAALLILTPSGSTQKKLLDPSAIEGS